ncbi:MAG: ROK family protein [Candidatus Krumholzibacteriota bacterium]|nr:ROK family protein [Candidatus Krumholzibacteriota bacterium]
MVIEMILGVDIGGTNIKLGIITSDGGIVEEDMIYTDAEKGPAYAAARIEDWYRKRKGDYPGIGCAGIGCAGLIDAEKGFLYYSPNLPEWVDTDLGRIFAERLDLPVTVENDVNCAAWAEYKMGSGRDSRYFVCITLGTGVGGGIVIDGRLYRGWRGFAAEIGHQVIMADGPVCSCGNRGCLEALVGAAAIVDRYLKQDDRPDSQSSGKGKISVKDIYEAAGAGDQRAAKALEETGKILGIGLANIANILDPELIAVGGGVSGSGDMILEPARITMKEHLIGDILSPVRVVPAELGNKASFLGAALLALEKY